MYYYLCGEHYFFATPILIFKAVGHPSATTYEKKNEKTKNIIESSKSKQSGVS